jgi:hypothetical protein
MKEIRMQAANLPASFSVLALVSSVSLLVLAALFYFGFLLNHRSGNAQINELVHLAMHPPDPKADVTLVSTLVVEWYTRRNEFWTSYGQFMLSAFVIAAITILLLTRTISAEAGLPILAGVGGFAIGKGTSSRGNGIVSGRTQAE